MTLPIQCECGKFRAERQGFPQNTPGRLMCYCDDCQTYLHCLKRGDLLDANGGTEVIPVYPADLRILAGEEHVQCLRLSPKGMFRFFAACCNTPIGNTAPGSPWMGLLRCVHDGKQLDEALGPIRARIMGAFAKGTPPPGTPKKIAFSSFAVVVPYMLKGLVFGKGKPSPFFPTDGKTPLAPPRVLGKEERNRARAEAGLR